MGAGYQHRFRLDDAEVWAGAVRKIPGTRAYAGGSVGGATRHVLLPALRAALEGGAGLGSGFSADARTEWRRYDNAHTLVFSPG
ncbi:MAG: hypothetical protein M0D55_06115 [Elusimicrobiota bacterium]|nr:MAG: hypothetical protein M0D55_06115 [Elusimicrobiota bacterium]